MRRMNASSAQCSPAPPPCVQTLLFALAVKKGSDELIWLGTIEILRYITAEAPIAFAG